MPTRSARYCGCGPDDARQLPPRPWPSIRPTLGATLALVALLAVGGARAEVFHAKDEALHLAFPDATSVVPITLFLTDAQTAAVKERTGMELESQLFTYYVARGADGLLGYAVIETHVVRTLPETALIVLSPTGHVKRVLLLAFYEPKEYMPPVRWLEQFSGRDADAPGWRLGRDVHAISGATLTARALTQAVRKILVLYQVAIGVAPPHP